MHCSHRRLQRCSRPHRRQPRECRDELPPAGAPISRTAFATLLLIALMMGANHVGARLAFNYGVDVVTAVFFRSAITAGVVGALVWLQRVPVRLTPRHQRALPAIGLLIAVQSMCIYSSVARLPVALALLAFNTYPLWTALWARLVYQHRPEPRLLRAMPVMLLGLALTLDALGAASGLGAAGQWAQIGVGVAFALAVAATFGLALVITQHEAADLGGRSPCSLWQPLAGLLIRRSARSAGRSNPAMAFSPLLASSAFALGRRWTLTGLPCLALAALVLGLGPAAAQPVPAAPGSSRSAEMASCLPGELATWPDGQDRPAPAGAVRLVYRHAGAPAGFAELAVVAALQRAAAGWSACGVAGEVISEAAIDLPPGSPVQVGWDDAATRGNFALADVGRRRLWLSAAMFALLAQRNPRHPAQQTLQMAISHEMGHFFGLMAHSRRCVDVMSYYRFGPAGEACQTRDGRPYTALPEYRALLPTACDIARCRAVNRLP